MSRTYTPATVADGWAPILAELVKHWKTSYSARTLAHCWQDAKGFPTEVANAIEAYPVLRGTAMLPAFPEQQATLAHRATKSQSDIRVLGKCDGQLISFAVEGKVGEPFDRTLAEWLESGTPGRHTRLDFFAETLGLREIPLSIRYQLLRRAASAILGAERFNADHAVMLVHSFSPTNAWFEDYRAFAALFGLDARPNCFYSAKRLPKTELHLGWICGASGYLAR
ncbi:MULTISPECIES: DUF6946 family protein [Cupriavidus]|uniref:DUF6946 family protein n=1 Tax=Cupriavidus sp. SK-3 TaxID=1470558 RepID=UPI00045388AE|nr:hypothetical protein [Cupriavidus sp. SK-3]KDP87787.1 hypothetical protein CF70_034305 [Cupriavidus sp. SK-3]